MSSKARQSKAHKKFVRLIRMAWNGRVPHVPFQNAKSDVEYHALALGNPGLITSGAGVVARHPDHPKFICGEIRYCGFIDGRVVDAVVFRGHATRSVRHCWDEIRQARDMALDAAIAQGSLF